MIFTREIDDHLTSLVKKLDAEVAKANKEKKNSMGAFVVYLTDDDGADKKLKQLAEKENIKNVSLTVDSVAGPPNYKVAKDAAVTVVYYKAGSVKANHAFKKGEFDGKAVAAAAADVSKITQ
jgi:hypothetical protein